MFCPLYSNKEVFDGFNEMVEAFGGKAMTEEEFRSSELRMQREGLDFSAVNAAYDVYNLNNGNFLDKAPNGEPSILFQSLLERNGGNRKLALRDKLKYYTKKYRDTNGDWINSEENDIELDQNGEPIVHIKQRKKSLYDTKLSNANADVVFGVQNATNMSKQLPVSSNRIITHLIKSQLFSENNFGLAEALSIHDIPIVFGTLENRKLAAAVTNQSGETVIIINQSEINNVTTEYLADRILHELVHALTVPAISNPVTEAQNKFAKANHKLFSMLDKIVSKTDRYDVYSGSYVMQNEKEFAAVFATDENARSFVYNKARQQDNKSNIRNYLKNFINYLSNILIDIDVIKSNEQKVKDYERLIKDYLYNRPKIQFQSDNIENIINSIFKSNIANDNINDFQKALINAEILAEGVQINYSTVQHEYTFDDIVRTINTRLHVIKRSNLGKDIIARQAQLIKSQSEMLVSDYASKLQALKNLSLQIGPQLRSDFDYIKTLSEIPLDEYMTIAHTNVGTYKKLAKMAQKLLVEPDEVSKIIQATYMGPDVTTEEGSQKFQQHRDNILKDLSRLVESFNGIENLANSCEKILDELRTKSVASMMLKIGHAVRDPEIEEYVNNLYSIDRDINWFTQNVGAADSANDKSLNILAYLINQADTKVKLDVNNVAIKLAKAASKVSRKDFIKLYELDDNNKTTGFLTRLYNFGNFYDDYNKEITNINREISKKYNIVLKDNNRLAPNESEARKEWNHLRNKWLETHCKRRYKDQYYRAQEKLSTEALLRMQAINNQIYQIKMLPGIIQENGKPDYFYLTDEQWEELQNLITKKRFLRKEFDEWGNEKCDAEKRIAKEIDEYYKEIYGDTSDALKKDHQSWKDQRQKIFEECGGIGSVDDFDKSGAKFPDGFNKAKWNKWNSRNSKLEFILDIDGRPLVFKQIEYDFGQSKPFYGDEEAAVAKEINDRINTFYGTNKIINDKAMTRAMQNSIKKLIKKQIQLRKKAIKNDPNLEKLSKKYGAVFNSYIEFKSTERYNNLSRQALEKSTEDGSFDEMLYWDLMSNYGDLIEDWDTAEILGIRPYRWFTEMRAKDVSRFMVWQPGDAYIDAENSSSLKNSKEDFDDSLGVSFIPNLKIKRYNNQKNYARFVKIQGYENLYDENLAELYKTVVDVLKSANSKMKNREYADDYLLPQISGTLYTRLVSDNKEDGGYISRKWKLIVQWIYEKLGIRPPSDDDPLVGQLEEKIDDNSPIDTSERVRQIGLSKDMPDGRSMHMIPQFFTNRKNSKFISRDLLNIVALYYQMASNYQHKTEVRDKCEAIVDMLEHREIKKTEGSQESTSTGKESRTYQMAQTFLEMNLYDVRRKHSTFKNWKWTYAVDQLNKYTTVNNLGMNPKVSVVGLLTAGYNHFINSITGYMYGFSDATRGGCEVISQCVQSLIQGESYLGNIDSKNRLSVIDEFYNVSNMLNKKLQDSNVNRPFKVFFQHAIFGGMASADFIIKNSIALSILYSYRWVNGEFYSKDRIYREASKIEDKNKRKQFIDETLTKYNSAESLYTILDTDTGKVLIKDKKQRDAYNKIHHEVLSRIEKIAERADGMATKTQKAAITQNVLGAAVLTHRQYLPLMIQERFSNTVFDYDMSMYKNGQHRLFFNYCTALMSTSPVIGGALGASLAYAILRSTPYIGNYISLFGAAAGIYYSYYSRKNKSNESFSQINQRFFNDNSSETSRLKSHYNKKMLKQIFLELLTYNILSAFVKWVCGKADKDKDEWWLQFTALCLRQFEWEAYTPYRFDDIFNNIKSVGAITGTIDYIQSSVGGILSLGLELFPILLNTLAGNEEKDSKTIRSGVYQYWKKENKDLMKAVPIHNWYEQGFYTPGIGFGGAVGSYYKRKYLENKVFRIQDDDNEE